MRGGGEWRSEGGNEGEHVDATQAGRQTERQEGERDPPHADEAPAAAHVHKLPVAVEGRRVAARLPVRWRGQPVRGPRCWLSISISAETGRGRAAEFNRSR